MRGQGKRRGIQKEQKRTGWARKGKGKGGDRKGRRKEEIQGNEGEGKWRGEMRKKGSTLSSRTVNLKHGM